MVITVVGCFCFLTCTMKGLDDFIIDTILQVRRLSHREVLFLEVVFQLLNGGIMNSSNGA